LGRAPTSFRTLASGTAYSQCVIILDDTWIVSNGLECFQYISTLGRSVPEVYDICRRYTQGVAEKGADAVRIFAGISERTVRLAPVIFVDSHNQSK
jgi:hypothetical protein